ncbi:MAG: hypothetical protein RL748_2003 [Pseudomonadota bacterium]
MPAHALTESQLRQPWLSPWFEALQRLRQNEPDLLAALNRQAQHIGLHNANGQPLRFVPQSALPPDCAYESFIDSTGQVPTREHLHDFFNALIWLSFPRVKQQLNRMQARQIAANGVNQVRGAVRDGITLFDENAAIVVFQHDAAGEALAQALRQHQWQHLLQEQSAAWGQLWQVHLFGHALLEKLCNPYKAITAHGWIMFADAAFFRASSADQMAWIDATLAQQLQQANLHTRCFAPLPVLGIPGWWPGQDAAFYSDTAVFRAPRPRMA